ncbi:MAG TPA: hypothetical protein VGV37_25500 [Aliidongia sp.]|uniref:hypothetical protein n=1 Tax=Aliidongia sp. TaxID=1914230 RepID=UPI002DDD9AF5|nr:hypothetical protein [Aliidongia sp.]HEV2677912.1 hypothetical protein [Aliidongia sp.]
MRSSFVKFRLADRTSDSGLDCSEQGLSLGGVPLLCRGGGVFRPRPGREIDWLISRAYEAAFDAAALFKGLDSVARALNEGMAARGMIAAVLLKLPRLDWDGLPE